MALPDSRPIRPSRAATIEPLKKPSWLKIRPPSGENYLQIKGLLEERGLHTVCQEARCPNLTECWASGTATLMLGSEVCTRACRFCAVKTARRPPPLDLDEPVKVATTVADLKLKYVVLTMVDRDDLRDGGSLHFAKTIREIKARDPGIVVEALVSDFRGDPLAVRAVVESGVDVYAHNVETVKRLQYRVRDPRAGYEQSLRTLVLAKAIGEETGRRLFTKSSLMLGLGETTEEVEGAFEDLRQARVDVLTMGQYLRPSLQHLPVEAYLTPEAFQALGENARSRGFMYVASGPMVRSSYRAAEFFIEKAVREGHNSETTGNRKGHANGT